MGDNNDDNQQLPAGDRPGNTINWIIHGLRVAANDDNPPVAAKIYLVADLMVEDFLSLRWM